tara:strand:- start:3179 stop:3853 length:675 start_codon:yes stop_codon:yes gene_type:complete
MIQIQKHNLFSTPIYRTKISPSTYDKKKIVEDIEYNFNITDDRNCLDGHLSASSYLHMHYNDEDNKKFRQVDLSSLNDVYKDYCFNFLQDIKTTSDKGLKFGFKMVNYTASKHNNFMRAHNHQKDCDFALIHYVQFEPGVHSSTVFTNPGKYQALHNMDVREKFYKQLDHTQTANSNYHEFFELNTEEDDCIVFPSYLHHEIPRAKKPYSKLRIAVVCNIWLEG